MKSLWKTGGGDVSPYFPFVRDGGGGRKSQCDLDQKFRIK